MHSLHHVHRLIGINWTTLRDFIFGNHIWRRGNRLVLWFLIHWKDPQWCVYIVNPVVKTICDEKPTHFNKHAAPPFSNNHFSTHPLLYIPTFVFTHPLLYLLNCVYTYFCIYSLYYSPTFVFIHFCIYSHVYIPIFVFTHFSIYPLLYLFTCVYTHCVVSVNRFVWLFNKIIIEDIHIDQVFKIF